MAQYLIELSEVMYHTYKVDVPDDVENVDEYFYCMSHEDQQKSLVVSESFTWEITNMEKLEG